MKCIIFGTGEYYRRYLKYIKKLIVVSVVDNDREKQGKYIDGYLIESPDTIQKQIYDKIYICSSFCNDIHDQLLNMGVNESKIFYYFDFQQQQGDYIFQSNSNHGKGKKIALISHDFSITGAQNCLLPVAKYLQDNDCHVIVGSPYDGDMKSSFLQEGAEVYIDKRLRMGNLDTIEWVNECDMVLVNTVQLYYLMRTEELGIPIVWWIHEPQLLYKSVIAKVFNEIKCKNIHIYSVSSIADAGIRSIIPDISVKRLMFGVCDSYSIYNMSLNKMDDSNLVNIVMVGDISKLKGHDLLINALKLLNKQERSRIRIKLIGDDTSDFALKIRNKVEKYELPVEFVGRMTHERTLLTINQCDMLICASICETMSMATVEAMMLKKVVIVSDACGIAQYIKNNVNGYVFKTENIIELANKIRYVIHNRKKRYFVSKNARKTYETKFEMKKFYEALSTVFNI